MPKTISDVIGKMGDAKRDKDGNLIIKKEAGKDVKGDKKAWTYYRNAFEGESVSKGRTGNNTLIKSDSGYTESTGGGTPLAKGEKLKNHPEAHRVSQPRDEDGQFTYNSANKKPLAYRPSRGTSVPPMLRGMKITYAKKTGNLQIMSEGKFYRIMSTKELGEFASQFKEWSEKEDDGKISSTKLSEKVSGQTGNPQWGQRNIQDIGKGNKAAKYIDLGGGGQQLDYEGGLAEISNALKNPKYQANDIKPKYAKAVNGKNKGQIKKWTGNKAPQSTPSQQIQTAAKISEDDIAAFKNDKFKKPETKKGVIGKLKKSKFAKFM